VTAPRVPGLKQAAAKPIPTSGTWRATRSDARVLAEWQQRAGHHDGLDRFVAEIISVAVAEFRESSRRKDSAPPFAGAAEKPIEAASGFFHQKLREAQIEKIRQLRGEGVSIAAIAERFSVTHSTIRRVLLETAEEEEEG